MGWRGGRGGGGRGGGGGGGLGCRPPSSPGSLADPARCGARSEKILRACVHCGFCTATCPTYLLLGDELDSPRGRIYLIKDMLEGGKPATKQVVQHVDRCLSCLSCMTTCPSGVHDMHLVDHARAHIEKTLSREPIGRPASARACSPWRCLIRRGFAPALALARASRKPLEGAGCARFLVVGARMAAMRDARAASLPPTARRRRLPCAVPASEQRHGPRRHPRRAAPSRCWSLRSSGAAARLFAAPRRRGRRAAGQRAAAVRSCITWGAKRASHAFARANIEAWHRRDRRGRARGDRRHGVGLRHDGQGLRLHAARRYGRCARRAGPRVSARHGHQRISRARSRICRAPPRAIKLHRRLSLGLLDAARAARSATEPKTLLQRGGLCRQAMWPEGHICCGSAGVYNMLQPQIAGRLRDRKVANIARAKPRSSGDRQYRLHRSSSPKASPTGAGRGRSFASAGACIQSSSSTGRLAGSGRKASERPQSEALSAGAKTR